MQIADIQEALREKRFRITDHADEEAKEDEIILDDILHSVRRGDIIENYPTDLPYPSCLVLGTTPSGRPLHSVWAYDESNSWAVLVPVYCPDPARWIDWRISRR